MTGSLHLVDHCLMPFFRCGSAMDWPSFDHVLGFSGALLGNLPATIARIHLASARIRNREKTVTSWCVKLVAELI